MSSAREPASCTSRCTSESTSSSMVMTCDSVIVTCDAASGGVVTNSVVIDSVAWIGSVIHITVDSGISGICNSAM